jgi:hypothetical protein
MTQHKNPFYVTTSETISLLLMEIVLKHKVFPVHTMNVCEGVEVQLNSFLTLALDVGVWSASCSCHFIPEKGVSSTH